jgi:hypothetical protein
MEKTDKLTAEEKWELLTLFVGSAGLVVVVWGSILLLMWGTGY